jgi:hypothetical protein
MMRKTTGRSLSGFPPKLREIDGSKGAARQAAANRSRLRLYAAREPLRNDKGRHISRGES